MNTYTVKILIFFLSVFILITVSSQIYLAFQDTYETETAIEYTASEKISFKGVYIRNEKTVNYDGNGVVSYAYPDGSKIAKDSEVASIYSSENDILIKQKLDSYNQELKLLQKAQSSGTTQVAQPEFIADLISKKYQSITVASERNDFEKIREERSQLLTLMNIMKIVVKKENNYNERINYLQSQIDSLKSQQGEVVSTLKVDEPGYFVSYIDGYEDKFNFDSINSLTVEQISAVEDKKITADSSDKLGKIISGYKWKIVGVIDNSKNLYTTGSPVKLKIASSPEPVSAVIEDIKKTDNTKESIIIISCDKLTYQYVQHRTERVEVILGEYSGIKVPRSAIRFLGGQKGVYVQMGQQISFRKINVIFEGDDYVISKNTGVQGDLLLYDDIVVEGIEQNDKTPETTAETENTALTTEGAD